MAQDSVEKKAEYERRIYALVKDRAQAWDQAGRPDELLLQGADLDRIDQWFTSTTDLQPKPAVLLSQYVIASLSERQKRRDTVFIGIARRLELVVQVFMSDVRAPLAILEGVSEMMRQSLDSQPDNSEYVGALDRSFGKIGQCTQCVLL
jgi:hypothetical protein